MGMGDLCGECLQKRVWMLGLDSSPPLEDYCHQGQASGELTLAELTTVNQVPNLPADHEPEGVEPAQPGTIAEPASLVLADGVLPEAPGDPQSAGGDPDMSQEHRDALWDYIRNANSGSQALPAPVDKMNLLPATPSPQAGLVDSQPAPNADWEWVPGQAEWDKFQCINNEITLGIGWQSSPVLGDPQYPSYDPAQFAEQQPQSFQPAAIQPPPSAGQPASQPKKKGRPKGVRDSKPRRRPGEPAEPKVRKPRGRPRNDGKPAGSDLHPGKVWHAWTHEWLDIPQGVDLDATRS